MCERDINRYYFQVQTRKKLRKIFFFFFVDTIVCHSDPLLWIEASIMSVAKSGGYW